VAKRVSALQIRYLADDARAVASLAKLRRGIGRPLGESVELVELTVAGFSSGTAARYEASHEEQAIYTAITLFSIHQQSFRNDKMHLAEAGSIGRAAKRLKQHGSEDAVRRRFVALGTATHWDETVMHARGLISRFRTHGIPLDYGRFATDLLSLRLGPYADRVRLAWGRDFFTAPSETRDNETQEISA
jgi:CRISPR system Cascade subunit CasB